MLSNSRMKKRYFFLIFFITAAISSCRKPDEFPVDPVITYKSISSTRDAQGFDEKLTVLLDFTDGDGDVGYKSTLGENGPPYDDPNSQYYNNYHAKLFQFKDTAWVEYPTVLPLGGRLPYLTPEGKIKTLKGEIACDFDVPPAAAMDTFRMEIFIYDRALHQSNTVTSSVFVLKTH